jgi:hypothetical protein
MALDASVREANIRDSLKKYFYDRIKTIETVAISFDKGLTNPEVQGNKVDKWVAVAFGAMELDSLAAFPFTIFCCTKNDAEGFKLAQLRDKVVGYLIDYTMTDGLARIPIYRSSATEAWQIIETGVVQIDAESQPPDAEDGTKFKIIDVRLRWGAKC